MQAWWLCRIGCVDSEQGWAEQTVLQEQVHSLSNVVVTVMVTVTVTITVTVTVTVTITVAATQSKLENRMPVVADVSETASYLAAIKSGLNIGLSGLCQSTKLLPEAFTDPNARSPIYLPTHNEIGIAQRHIQRHIQHHYQHWHHQHRQ